MNGSRLAKYHGARYKEFGDVNFKNGNLKFIIIDFHNSIWDWNGFAGFVNENSAQIHWERWHRNHYRRVWTDALRQGLTHVSHLLLHIFFNAPLSGNCSVRCQLYVNLAC